LMIHSISSLVKQYSEAIESVDEGPMEALRATGATRIATAWFAVVPQVILPYFAFTIYRWDINVRMATIIGLVGGGGIGGLLIQEQGLANWSRVGTIAFLIFLVVWTMDFLSAKVREAIQ
jgi:phosphonate transport system permease protein